MMTNFRGSSYSIETDKDVSFSQANEENVRIAMVGVSEVGKTSIVNCIEKERFSEQIESTNGFQIHFKRIKVYQQLIVNLTVWDCGGDRLLQFIKEGKLHSFDGIIYVYDLTNSSSIIQLQQIYAQISQREGNHFVNILIGNKADLALQCRAGSKEYHIPESNEAYFLGCKFSERHHMIHQKVSAKLNSCVTDSFVIVIKQILNEKRPINTSRIGDDEENVVKQKGGRVISCPQCVSCPRCGQSCQII